MIAPHLQHNLARSPPEQTSEQASLSPPEGSPEQPPLSEADSLPSSSVPAYLPTTASSPLLVSQHLYRTIQTSPRTLVSTHPLPPRSGLALPLPAKSILRISLPTGPQVVDLNLFAYPNHTEHFWASRTRQLHASHLTTFSRLWSNLPYLRPLATMIADTLTRRLPAGVKCHDLLGTRCDPYVSRLLTADATTTEDHAAAAAAAAAEENDGSYDFHCHSNLTRAVLPYGIPESGIHDVLNLFQVTHLDEQGRYVMDTCPAVAGDYVEFFIETEVLVALSACPGGDLSVWGFGAEGMERSKGCCREVRVEVFRLEDKDGGVLRDWKGPVSPVYRGLHGMRVPIGEGLWG